MSIKNIIKEQLNLIIEGNYEEIYIKFYNKIPIDIFTQIVSADPTTPIKEGKPDKLGKYSKWLLKLYNEKKLKIEDLYKATEYLTVYTKFNNKIEQQNRDINQIKTLPDLYKIISPFEGTKTQGEIVKDIKKDVEKVFEDSIWLVVVPKTEEAACYYGANTQWCTASKNNNMFNHYNREGKLYININKSNKEKFQFHFESGQLMDENDSEIEVYTFFKANPQLEVFYRPIYRPYLTIKQGDISIDYNEQEDYYYIDVHEISDLADHFKNSDFAKTILNNDLENFDTFIPYENNMLSSLDAKNTEKIKELGIEYNKGEYGDDLEEYEEIEDISEITDAIEQAYSDAYRSAEESSYYNAIIKDLKTLYEIDFNQSIKMKIYKDGKPNIVDGIRCKLKITSAQTLPQIITNYGDEFTISFGNGDDISDGEKLFEISDNNYYSIDEEYFNELLQEKLDEISF